MTNTDTCRIAHIVRRTTADPKNCDQAATTTVRTTFDVLPACDAHAADYRSCNGVVQTPLKDDEVVNVRHPVRVVGKVVKAGDDEALVYWPRAGAAWAPNAHLELVATV